MILTNYFINKELDKLMHEAVERVHQYRSMNEIRNILVVCDNKDWDVARSCIEKLRAMGKTVNSAVYSPSAKDVPTWYSNYLLLRADRDVNIFGFPEKTMQRQFNSLPADLIIDFSGEKSPAMYYLVLQHPSTFKAGIKRSDASVYDFAIIPNEDEEIDLKKMFEQLLNYLMTITSK